MGVSASLGNVNLESLWHLGAPATAFEHMQTVNLALVHPPFTSR